MIHLVCNLSFNNIIIFTLYTVVYFHEPHVANEWMERMRGTMAMRSTAETASASGVSSRDVYHMPVAGECSSLLFILLYETFCIRMIVIVSAISLHICLCMHISVICFYVLNIYIYIFIPMYILYLYYYLYSLSR